MAEHKRPAHAYREYHEGDPALRAQFDKAVTRNVLCEVVAARADLHQLVRQIREARVTLSEAESVLYGIFGVPSDDPERARRIRQATRLRDEAAALFARTGQP